MANPPMSGSVNAHGLDLHYLDWGNESAPLLLLLHGLQDSAALWATFAEAMRDDFHVVALDHRGHGASPRAETYALTDYVEETREVVERLGLHGVTLIGHSAGSKNAWMCIAEHPGIASRLVITDMDPDSYNPGSVAMVSRYKGEGDEYDSIGKRSWSACARVSPTPARTSCSSTPRRSRSAWTMAAIRGSAAATS